MASLNECVLVCECKQSRPNRQCGNESVDRSLGMQDKTRLVKGTGQCGWADRRAEWVEEARGRAKSFDIMEPSGL